MPSRRVKKSTENALNANNVSAAPIQTLRTVSTARMPTSSTPAPRIWNTNCENTEARVETSPSMRSISSPGVRALWKLMSSARQWRARSSRKALVALQPTEALK